MMTMAKTTTKMTTVAAVAAATMCNGRLQPSRLACQREVIDRTHQSCPVQFLWFVVFNPEFSHDLPVVFTFIQPPVSIVHSYITMLTLQRKFAGFNIYKRPLSQCNLKLWVKSVIMPYNSKTRRGLDSLQHKLSTTAEHGDAAGAPWMHCGTDPVKKFSSLDGLSCHKYGISVV